MFPPALHVRRARNSPSGARDPLRSHFPRPRRPRAVVRRPVGQGHLPQTPRPTHLGEAEAKRPRPARRACVRGRAACAGGWVSSRVAPSSRCGALRTDDDRPVARAVSALHHDHLNSRLWRRRWNSYGRVEGYIARLYVAVVLTIRKRNNVGSHRDLEDHEAGHHLMRSEHKLLRIHEEL